MLSEDAPATPAADGILLGPARNPVAARATIILRAYPRRLAKGEGMRQLGALTADG